MIDNRPPPTPFTTPGIPALPAHLLPPAADSPAGRILNAACAGFAESGYKGTSTRSIAQQAGVNLALIHYYFGSKEKLYRRVVEQELLDLHRIIAETLGTDAAPGDVLLQVPLFALRLHREHPLLMRILLREMADGAPHLANILQELGNFGPRGLRTMLLEQIRRGQQDGWAQGIEPAYLLAILFSIGNGLQAFAPLLKEVFAVDLQDEQDRAELGRTVQTIFRKALAPGDE